MRLESLRNTNPPSDLKKIDSSEYELVWISDYYDAPISGMLEYENKLYWFEMTQWNENWKEESWFRRYGVVKLTKEQLDKELKVHECFQKYVGTHWDVKLLKKPPKLIEGQSNKFYDKYSDYVRSDPFEGNELIGWIER